MKTHSIYIADDQENIRNVVKSFLESEGYQVTAFADGDALLAAFARQPCDLVILDVMMPGSDGFAVCRQLRQASTVPIIMLTARDSDLDYATGINLGSDDYFTKPFSAMSLVMRVKAILRRVELERSAREPTGCPELGFADLKLEPATRLATLAGRPLQLTPNEFNLLLYLLEHRERAVSRDELLDRVWGYTSQVQTRAADDTVRRLRRKLEGSRTAIDTVWGFGFRLLERDAHDA